VKFFHIFFPLLLILCLCLFLSLEDVVGKNKGEGKGKGNNNRKRQSGLWWENLVLDNMRGRGGWGTEEKGGGMGFLLTIIAWP